MKKLSETRLYKYHNSNHEKQILDFILKGERIDKSHESFNDIKYEVKRKNVDSTLVKLLDSERIVLVLPSAPLPKYLKVLTSADPRDSKKTKVFIDCTGVLEPVGTGYKLINKGDKVNILISYLIAARTAFVWEAKPTSITMNTGLTQSGTRTFAALVNYIVDYIGKININVETRNKSLYLASIYYQVNILEKDPDSQSVRTTAMKIAGISDRQANVIELDFEEDSFKDIETFVNTMATSLHIKGLTLDTFIEKWMFVFGTGTTYATELFPYFAQMITDAYIGAYINNQKNIEKVAGRNMIEFSKTLIDIGSDS